MDLQRDLDHKQKLARAKKPAREKSIVDIVAHSFARGVDPPDDIARDGMVAGHPVLVYVYVNRLCKYPRTSCNLVDYAYKHQPQILPQLIEYALLSDLERIANYGVDLSRSKRRIDSTLLIDGSTTPLESLTIVWALVCRGVWFTSDIIRFFLVCGPYSGQSIRSRVYGLISRLLSKSENRTHLLGDIELYRIGGDDNEVAANPYFWWLARRYPELWSIVPGRSKVVRINRTLRSDLAEVMGRNLARYVLAWS